MSANEQSSTFFVMSDQDMEKNETQILKTLLSDLHKYVTSHTDINNSHFELPCTVKPGTHVAEHYRQALDIYIKFKEIQSENDSNGIGDGGENNIVMSGCSKGMTDTAQSLSEQRERQNQNFRRTLSAIEEMKQRAQAHRVKKEKKVAKKKRKELLKIIEENEKQIQRLEDENATAKENLQIQNDSNKFIDEKWKSDRDLLQSSLVRQEIMEKQMAQLQKAYDGEVSKSQVQMKQINDLQREKNELINRLSKLAGDMLKHENTNLTDLSDVDRPTNLSEAYSELYDNEWTDAFEELTHHGLTENDAVVKLLDMLLVSFHKCREIAWERYRTLKSIVSTIDIVHVPSSVGAFSEGRIMDVEMERQDKATQTEVQGYTETLQLSDGYTAEVRNGRKENHLTSTMILSTEQERQIKDIWRTTTKVLKQETIKHLYTVLLSRFDTPIKDLVSTSKYLTSCIDLCWKMVVQEKPMYLDSVAAKNGGSDVIFDLDNFRAYTKSGEIVDFVVWPALFLHEGGPLLLKGIAQGCYKSDS